MEHEPNTKNRALLELIRLGLIEARKLLRHGESEQALALIDVLHTVPPKVATASPDEISIVLSYLKEYDSLYPKREGAFALSSILED